MNRTDSEVSQIAQALAAGRLTINRLDDGSGVLLDAQREQLLSMNRTGLMIVEAIADGMTTESAIAQHLGHRFGIEPEHVQQDLRWFSERLAEAL